MVVHLRRVDFAGRTADHSRDHYYFQRHHTGLPPEPIKLKASWVTLGKYGIIGVVIALVMLKVMLP